MQLALILEEQNMKSKNILALRNKYISTVPMEESVEKVLEGWNNRRASWSADGCPLYKNLCRHSPIDLILPYLQDKVAKKYVLDIFAQDQKKITCEQLRRGKKILRMRWFWRAFGFSTNQMGQKSYNPRGGSQGWSPPSPCQTGKPTHTHAWNSEKSQFFYI